MKGAALKNAIEAAYAEIEKLALADARANDLLRKALFHARNGERQHRRVTGVYSKAFTSIEVAAKYFVVKWFWDPAAQRPPRSWLDAAIRLDALYSYALHQTLGPHPLGPFRPEWLDSVDYATHIIGPRQPARGAE